MINGHKSKSFCDDEFDYSAIPTHDQVIARLQRVMDFLSLYNDEEDINVGLLRNYLIKLFGDIVEVDDLEDL
jgi:hypothetical protein